MAHKKLTERKTPAVLSPSLTNYFETGQKTGECFFLDGKKLQRIWNAVKEKFLSDFISENPGRRPHAWWELSAPQERVKGWPENFQAAQRRRLGGIGTPSHEVLAVSPNFELGIPTSWVTKFEVEYYNGRAKDIHGNIISTKYKDGDFEAVAIDPDAPPTFESEAVFLDRHDLLTPAEKKYLALDPGLLKPEIINL